MVKKEPNYKLHVLYALTTGFVLVFVIHLAKGQLSLIDTSKSEDTLRNTFTGDSVDRAVVAWGVLALVLFSMAAFDSTASLAAAFAWLILISVILVNTQTLLKIMGAYNKAATT
jgi:hypothetical protein